MAFGGIGLFIVMIQKFDHNSEHMFSCSYIGEFLSLSVHKNVVLIFCACLFKESINCDYRDLCLTLIAIFTTSINFSSIEKRAQRIAQNNPRR